MPVTAAVLKETVSIFVCEALDPVYGTYHMRPAFVRHRVSRECVSKPPESSNEKERLIKSTKQAPAIIIVHSTLASMRRRLRLKFMDNPSRLSIDCIVSLVTLCRAQCAQHLLARFLDPAHK